MQTVSRSTSDLTLDPENARRHPRHNIEAIKESLLRFGQQRPLVIDQDGKVVAGNGTLEAARELGWAEIDVVETNLSESERAAFAVVDNRTSELSEWDFDILSALAQRGDLAIGFDAADIAALMSEGAASIFGKLLAPRLASISSLKPHPRNFKTHPADQLEHLAASIRANGFYRPVVIARDNTILAGHGVVDAARDVLHLESIPVVRLDCGPEDTRALKLLAGDNMISHLSEQDDRALSEMLREIGTTEGEDLLGTGFDAQMLAALAMVTRHADEIADHQEAEHWVGMPEFEGATGSVPSLPKLLITFTDEASRAEFIERNGFVPNRKEGAMISCGWPPQQQDDLASVEFQT